MADIKCENCGGMGRVEGDTFAGRTCPCCDGHGFLASTTDVVALRKRVEELENRIRQIQEGRDVWWKAYASAEAKLARVRERAFSDDVFADDEWYTRTRAALGSIRCILADTTKEGGNE